MLGWGVPMPILIKSRRYDDEFWQSLLGNSAGQKSNKQIFKELRLGK